MDLTLKSREDFLLATATGRVSLKEAIRVFTKACDMGAEKGLNLILVDCSSVEGVLSTLERYELGRTVAEHCASRCMNPEVATVGKPPVLNGFAAEVASNRGLLAETFSELESALSWLNRFDSKGTAT